MLAVVASGATAVAVAQTDDDPPGFPANFYGNVTDGDDIDAPVDTEVYAVVTENEEVTDTDSITVEEAGQYGSSAADEPKLSVDSSAGDTVRFYVDDPDDGPQASQSFDLESEGDGTYKQDLTFSDAQFDIESITLELGSTSLEPGDTTDATVTATRADDSTSEVTDATTITSTDDSVVNVSGSTIEAVDDGTATVEAELRGNTDSVEVSVGEADDDDDDDDDGGGGGGGGGGGAGDADDGAADDAPPTIAEVRSQLNLVDPSTTTQTEIADNDPDTPGTQVTPEGTEVVQSISFSEEGLSGNVDINEYSNPPQEIRSSVSESVSGAGAVDRGDISTISVVDITPDNDAAEESAATVTLSVPADEVTNPEQLTVVKETYSAEQQEDTWTELDTTLEEEGDEEITVSAQAESFSLFAVAEVEQPDEQPADDGAADDGEAPTDGGGPGPVVIIGVLVLLVVVGAAVYVFTQQGE